jgi:hypothetical protein
MTDLLKGLISFLEELSKLFPNDSAEYLETMQGIDTCRTKLLEQAPSGTSPGGQPPKSVTPGPAGGGSRRIGRIFAVLVLAALVVGVGVVFYRRNIVKVD